MAFALSLLSSSLVEQTPNRSYDDLLAALDEWERQVGPITSSQDSVVATELGNIDNEDAYAHNDASAGHRSTNEVKAVVQAIRNLQDGETLLHATLQCISSPRSSEQISSELAELLGFDCIELVSNILTHRAAVASNVTLALQRPRSPVSLVLSTDKHADRHIPVTNDGVIPRTKLEARHHLEASLKTASSRPLFSSDTSASMPEAYPHIYTSSSFSHGNMLSSTGHKYILPVDTTRAEREEYVEVTVPPAKPVPPRAAERLIPIASLDPLCRGSFPGYKTLNRIQSIIYETVYQTNENLLICAPTGAGKTDVAMLSILRVLSQYGGLSVAGPSSIRRHEFKIIYVAPMKALASEVVQKLGKRLAWLSIVVRELTGDMQLTQGEIAETQIIVTTPEKWDVVTRKPTGEGELASDEQKVRLLIIDEVHLLNEERGAVIETIVARTLRQVESTQSLIRIVGLSATLPNFRDVAEFLGVSPYHGLFYFDSSFRPVPLEQHFVGIRGKPGSAAAKKNLDSATFEKVSELVRAGHQVMVFVHARKETVKSALLLKETASTDGCLEDFSCEDHPSWSIFRRDISSSKNREMKELFDFGFGIHHAGMLRSDRNSMERLFAARAIKVLCCTATLAWGVNLPAHAVIIKGTQVYDTSRGAFVDLSVLDVLQIFGRAGRPGMEDSGEGFILTNEEKLPHYLDAATSQHPIESKFESGMIDALNGEISLGTVANVAEAMQWLSYTYLFVRMKRNPLVYGMPHEEPAVDPQLSSKREILVRAAGKKLAAARMIIFDETSGKFATTDLGRIASRYYIRYATVENFNKELRPVMSEADILGVVSMSTEFDQIQLRETEVRELKILQEEIIPCEVKGGVETSRGKVNILLQAFISQAYIEDFALVSDTAYSAQNGGRILRALLEIALSKKWAAVCATLMSLSKAVEKRMWPFEHPLKQFDLSREILYNLEQWADEWTISEIKSKTSAELGEVIHLNERSGSAVLRAANQFPALCVNYILRPLSYDLLRVIINLAPSFEWNPKVHGASQPFWIWLEDETGVDILQWSQALIKPNTSTLNVSFIIPVRGPVPPGTVRLRTMSERWLGAEEEISISLSHLVMPDHFARSTALLDISFLPVSVIPDTLARTHYATQFQDFNAIQTQCFWTFYHTHVNTLLCAPGGCGKSVMGHIAIWKAISKATQPHWALVIAPNRACARDGFFALRRLASKSKVTVELHASSTDLNKASASPTIRVVTADILSAASPLPTHVLVGLRVVLCEDLHMLDTRYELAVSLLMHATQTLPVRFVGISQSLYDPSGLARWLRISDHGLFSFRPNDRDQALAIGSTAFNIPFSNALLKTMVKPVHTALMSTPQEDAAIVFVPSRFHCRSVAADLITQCAVHMNTTGFLGKGVSADALQPYLTKMLDKSLVDVISNGIGLFHGGVHSTDQSLILQLFLEGIVRVLLVPHDSCWSVPVRAGTVIVMGTQYSHGSSPGAERQISDYTLQEITCMQSRAVRHGSSGHFHLFCQAESLDTFMRFLDQGLPLESQLLDDGFFTAWLNARRLGGQVVEKQDAMDVLSFTYLAHRVQDNPAYYAAETSHRDESLSRLLDHVWTQ